MDKNTFNEKIREILAQHLKPEGKVMLQQVRKNNGVRLESIVIQTPGSNVSPTIYIDEFYEMHEQGMEPEEAAARILTAYYKGRPKKELNLEFFKNFEMAKKRIVYRLINARSNEELLKEIPHVLIMDLAICFYYAFRDEQLGEGMITIQNKHMEWWDTNVQELMALAKENTPRLFPAQLISMKYIVEKVGGKVLEDLYEHACKLYVLTNRQKCQGAVCLLYDGKLEEIAEELGGSFYILPSSIHEVIIFKETGEENARSLHEMIRDINETQLDAEEVLSDYPYYYNRTEKKITCQRDF